MQPLTRDFAITVSDFTLAMAMQNLGWGPLQPLQAHWPCGSAFGL
jgi:hypothetical protein